MCESFLRESASFPDQRLESPVNNQSSFMEMFLSLIFGIHINVSHRNVVFMFEVLVYTLV